MNENELETAQQRFDRDMAEAHGDPHLMHTAQARHNGRVWGAAMARCVAVFQHLEELDRLITALQVRHDLLLSDEIADVEAHLERNDARSQQLQARLHALKQLEQLDPRD